MKQVHRDEPVHLLDERDHPRDGLLELGEGIRPDAK
jgi:hypothetical protein